MWGNLVQIFVGKGEQNSVSPVLGYFKNIFERGMACEVNQKDLGFTDLREIWATFSAMIGHFILLGKRSFEKLCTLFSWKITGGHYRTLQLALKN